LAKKSKSIKNIQYIGLKAKAYVGLSDRLHVAHKNNENDLQLTTKHTYTQTYKTLKKFRKIKFTLR